MPRAREILLPRVRPDRPSVPATLLLWSGSQSPEAGPLLASPASPQFLKLTLHFLWFYLPDWFLLLLPKEPLTVTGLERLK